jgi:hypothetical protein
MRVWEHAPASHSCYCLNLWCAGSTGRHFYTRERGTHTRAREPACR